MATSSRCLGNREHLRGRGVESGFPRHTGKGCARPDQSSSLCATLYCEHVSVLRSLVDNSAVLMLVFYLLCSLLALVKVDSLHGPNYEIIHISNAVVLTYGPEPRFALIAIECRQTDCEKF